MHETLKKGVNYYDLLHVQPDAPFEIIRASYLALMRDLKMHPDLGGEHFNAALLNEAYETLGNSARRTEYDRYLNPHARPGNGTRHIVSAAADITPACTHPGPERLQEHGEQNSGLTEPVSSVSTGQPLCRRCRSQLKRKRRPGWMRLLPFTKSYQCPLCKSSFISLNSRLIRI